MHTEMASAQKPVALYYNGIGDHLLILPTVRALAYLFPNRLRLVCDHRAPLFLFEDLRIKEILKIAFSREGKSRAFDAVNLASALRSCDVFISLVPWKSPSLQQLIAQLADPPSIGFTPGMGVHLDYEGPIHAVDSAFRIAKEISDQMVLSTFAHPPRLAAANKRDAAWIRRSLLHSAKLLVIHCDTSRKKMWPPDRFQKVISTFLKRHVDFDICIVGQASWINSDGERIINCHNLPLATSFALVALADLFLGVDSCMLHAADLFRVPSVGLFGPTLTNEWGLRFSSGISIQGDGTTESIDVEAVLSAMEWALVNRNHSEVWKVGP